MSLWFLPFLQKSFCSLEFLSQTLTGSLAASPPPPPSPGARILPFPTAAATTWMRTCCGTERGHSWGTGGAEIQPCLPGGEPLRGLPRGALWASRGPAFSASETTQIEDIPGARWEEGKERRWRLLKVKEMLVLVGFVCVFCLGLLLPQGNWTAHS